MKDQAMLDSRLNGPLANEIIAQAMQLITAMAPVRRVAEGRR